jgi:hypothetical protein
MMTPWRTGHFCGAVRRFGTLGGLGLSGPIAACGGSSDTPSATTTADGGTCVLSPGTTEGPYRIDDALSRRDIREGKAGLPLAAAFTVRDARSCEPIAGADVETSSRSSPAGTEAGRRPST